MPAMHLCIAQNGRHIVDGVFVDKPESGIFLKGRIASGASVRAGDGRGSFILQYGIERFYAPETIAPDLEKRMREGAITDVVVAINADGRPKYAL